MLFFDIALRTLEPVAFSANNAKFKGGVLHGLFEEAVKERGVLTDIKHASRSATRSLYSIFPPSDADDTYERGRIVRFGVNLHGDACKVWRDVVLALVQHDPSVTLEGRQFAVESIDLRTPDAGLRCIYEASGVLCDEELAPFSPELSTPKSVDRLALDFVTPVSITTKTRIALRLDDRPYPFKQVVRSLRERFCEVEPALATRFEFESDAWQKMEFDLKVAIECSQLEKPAPAWMWKGKKMSGLRGRIGYCGNIPGKVVSLLDLGQWIGIGQRTTMGLGWYRVCDLQ